MRILHVITKRQLRGAEIFASQLSEEFVREGHEVMIVALHPAAAFTTELGVAHVDFDLKPSQRWWSYGAWKKFATLVRTWKPDIVQANASETMKFTVISKTLFRWKAPLVYRNASKVSDFITSLPSKWVNTALARSVDFVISVSENCRVDYVETFNLPPDKTITIPIGTEHFEGVLPSKSSAASQARYWINVATLAPEKNHKGLLSIYKRYLEQGGQADLKIVGGGPAKASLEALAASMGLGSKVHFVGYSHDVARLMVHSEGLLLPSFIEGLPGVILEAMAVRVPVIANAVGGIPEVVRHNETGMLVEKGQEQPFVEAMLELERNPSVRARIVDNAFSVCYQDYRIEAIAHRFLAQYEKVMADHPRS
jgi:glycosyltransferase involved in cell wall biosynthesis